MRKELGSELTAKGSVVVIGASLSGLMTGIALSRAGLNVTILEKQGQSHAVELFYKLIVER